MKKEDIIKALESMTLIELNELVELIEKHFDVKQTMVMSQPANDSKSAVKATKVSVVMTESGNSKVALIKLLSQITGKGLMDAKKMIDTLPCVVKEDIDSKEAEELKNKLVEAGSTIELKIG